MKDRKPKMKSSNPTDTELYGLTKSRISAISKGSLSTHTKKAKIKQVLADFNDAYGNNFSPSLKGKVYLYSFSHNLLSIILLLEYIQSKGLKKYLPIHTFEKITYYTSRNDSYEQLEKGRKKIVITLAADYGNLGDVAITRAQHKFLEDNFKDYMVVELPISRTYRDLRSLKKKITNDDIITMVGGGNMGSLYEGIERQRQFIIRKFSNNKIVSFPQSIYYSQDRNGTKLLKRAVRAYGRHSNLTLLARDEASYSFMKEKFTKNTIDASPDVVLYLKESDAHIERDKNQVTLSLRQDKESGINGNKRQKFIDYLNKLNVKIVYRDTDLGEVRLGLEDGARELKDIWDIFRSSDLVVTDRLHGMIFCAITKTPCIAIDNNNGKVAGAYKKWLKNTSYISMIDTFDISIIKDKMRHLSTINPSALDDLDHTEEFEKLKKIVTGNL